MYIIKITDNSYKIILSKNDLSKYPEEIFKGGETSKLFFSDILSDLHTDRVHVAGSCIAHAEFFEDKYGGGELFICFHQNKSNYICYQFSSQNIEDIINICLAANRTDIIKASKLFLCSENYHLLLFIDEENPLLKGIIKEFGSCTTASELEVWQLEEHCRILIDRNAVNVICNHFKQHFCSP